MKGKISWMVVVVTLELFLWSVGLVGRIAVITFYLEILELQKAETIAILFVEMEVEKSRPRLNMEFRMVDPFFKLGDVNGDSMAEEKKDL